MEEQVNQPQRFFHAHKNSKGIPLNKLYANSSKVTT